MTLLEGILATVLLAVVAVACLDGTRGAAELQQRSSARAEALVAASVALEAASVDADVGAELAAVVSARAGVGARRDAIRTRRSSYRVWDAAGAPFARTGTSNGTSNGTRAPLERVDIDVALPDGGHVLVSRLVEPRRVVIDGRVGAPR